MDLLDLPPEIFGMVIHSLVCRPGDRNAWRLRSVCRTFKTTIEHEMFACQPIRVFRSQRASRFLRHNIGLYLYYRSKAPLDVHIALPTKVTQLVDYLGRELQHSSSQHADITRQILCEGISKVAAATTIIDMLLYGTVHGAGLKPERPLRSTEKLVGAMFMSEINLMKRILPCIKKWTMHVLFGYPMVAAVLLNQANSVNIILDHSRGMAGAKGKHLMYANGDTRETRLEASFQMPISAAIKNDSVNMVHDLMAWYNSHVRIISKATYNRYMEAAIRANSVAMVDQMLKVSFAKTQNTLTITAAQEDLIFQLRKVKILKMLMEKGHVKPHSRWLVEGVRSNQLDMAKLMARLGVDINTRYHKIPTRAVSAIEVAISTENLQALNWLLSMGATLPDKIKWRKERGVGREINKVIRRAQQDRRAAGIGASYKRSNFLGQLRAA